MAATLAALVIPGNHYGLILVRMAAKSWEQRKVKKEQSRR